MNEYLEALASYPRWKWDGGYSAYGSSSDSWLWPDSAFLGSAPFPRLPLLDRHSQCRHFAWAIPDDNAIATLVQMGPLVEIGAGRGYWAYLIRQAGGNIVAYDTLPNGNNWCEDGEPWTEVLVGDERKVWEHQNRTLFLCWPPLSSDMAYNALRNYTGSTVVFVGESRGGCTGDEAFHRELAKHWHMVADLPIPHWDAMHDSLMIYVRGHIPAEGMEAPA